MFANDLSDSDSGSNGDFGWPSSDSENEYEKYKSKIQESYEKVEEEHHDEDVKEGERSAGGSSCVVVVVVLVIVVVQVFV